MNALLSFEESGVTFGAKQVLSGIDLEIAEGEFVCVVGASGCGKTTMLRLFAGLLAPTRGRVCYDGKPLLGPRPEIAIVFQDYGKALLPWRTVYGNVELVLETAATPRRERPAMIAHLLDLMGLSDDGDKFPSELSGGMQQRVQIARSLAQKPQVLLMDEPFGALDAMTRQGLQDELQRLMMKQRMTVFFVTHDLEEAIYLADRVIALRRNPGRIGKVFDIKIARPRDQVATLEDPEFLRIRRELYDFIKDAELEPSA
ncbi:ABC transporter ATP-binding protein [Mesorhizobium sp. CAU 1732]|uniref:ABC transporter ATP-binding protein n=1 Tax=Mesorhizobium sp. CAU 1732 TaxID=3140358 RepID=UPI003260D278